VSSAARVSSSTKSRPAAASKVGSVNGTLLEGAGGTKPGAPAAPPTQHFAELAHAVHGRVRLRIPAARQNPGLLDRLKTTIGAIRGVDAIDVKASSGSLVIYYDPEHHPEVSNLLLCLSQMQAAPVMVAAAPPTAPQPLAAPHRPPSNRVDDLARNVEDEAEFLADHSMFARAVVKAVKRLDQDIKRSTNNNVDLKIMVPIALAGVTFLEVGAAAATPMWVTLAIFSMNHFVELHAHDADKS